MRRDLLMATVTTAFLTAPPALAQEAGDDGVEDVTMEVMDAQGQSEEEFVDRIELPDRASDTARERAGGAAERGRGDERRRPGEAAREAAQTAREARQREAPDDPETPD